MVLICVVLQPILSSGAHGLGFFVTLSRLGYVDFFFFFFSVIDMGQVLLRMCLRACMRDRTRGIRACAHVCSHKCMSDSHRLGAHAMFVINTNSRHTYCCMYEIL